MTTHKSLRLEAARVQFGAVRALDEVSIEFQPGEVHAVVGENGAGKSTLANALAGFVKLDGGVVLLGKESASREAGRGAIAMVHQHFRLVPAFSVKENFDLALQGSGGSMAQVMEVASTLGWTFDLSARVSDLSVGEQQRIEILKALSADPEVVIFDEPTPVLTEPEVEKLLETLRELARAGKIVIVIAHKLSEVFRCADQISVLRTGKLVATLEASSTTSEEVAKLMVGDVPELSRDRLEKQAESFEFSTTLVLSQSNSADIALSCGYGEVLGIGGVDGNGQTELAEALAGLSLSFGHHPLNVNEVAYIPQDRQRDGLAVSMSIEENLQIGRYLGSNATGATAIKDFDIKASGGNQLVKRLSGGNQQKVVLAREFGKKPRLVVAHNPTRGLDVRAAASVHQRLRDASGSGAAIILISTDRDELSIVSDRTLYLSRGKLFSTEMEAIEG